MVGIAVIAATVTMTDTTTIEIRQDQWAELNGMKKRPGETFKDVIDRLTAVYEEVEAEGIELEALADDEAEPEEVAAEHRTFEEVGREAERAAAEAAPEEDRALDPEQREALAAALDEQMEGWLVADTEERAEQRREAARAAVEYLGEQGVASKTDVIEAVEPEHPVSEQAPRTWYRKTVRPVFNEVAEYDNSKRGYVLTI